MQKLLRREQTKPTFHTTFLNDVGWIAFVCTLLSKMETEQFLVFCVIWISGFRWRKTYSQESRSWLKTKSACGNFRNLIRKLIIKDRTRFMFCMSANGFEFILKHIGDIRLFQNKCKYWMILQKTQCWLRRKTVGWKLVLKFSSKIIFRYSTWLFLFLKISKVFKPIQHFTQRVIISMFDEMLDWLALAFAWFNPKIIL